MKNQADSVTTSSPRYLELVAHKRAMRAFRNAQREGGDPAKAWAELKKKGAGVHDGPLNLGPTPANREFYRVLQDGAWTGSRCFIIGGGPSLKGFDFSQLKGELTIGVNRAYEFYPDCDIMFAIDKELYGWITSGKLGREAKDKFERFKGLKVWLGETVPDVFLLRNRGLSGLSKRMADGLCTGNNSGYAALNLAIILGANPIYLLGFDMKGDGQGGQKWFHDGYPQKQSESVYDRFNEHFEEAAPEIKGMGVRVVNLNPDSALKCFEFGTMEGVFGRPEGAIALNGRVGIGDSFYQRPVVRHLLKKYKAVYLRTPYPEAYWDIKGVKFVKAEGFNLRTQNEHVDALPKKTWSEAPAGADLLDVQAAFPRQGKGLVGINTAQNIKTAFGMDEFDFAFPLKSEWRNEARRVVKRLGIPKGKKLCVIHPPTTRREWYCPSRNPKPEYFQAIIDKYKGEYFFLAVGHIDGKDEKLVAQLGGVDAEFVRGELALTTIFGLMRIADMNIVPPGLFMLAGIALRAKTFAIFGGHDGPESHVDPIMGTQYFGYAAPDPFCRCHEMEHDCNKEIPAGRLFAEFERVRAIPKPEKVITVGVPPGLGDVHWVMTKMESFKEKNGIDKLRIAVCEDGLHKYTSTYLELLPFVDEIDRRKEHFKIGVFYGQKPFSLIRNYQDVDYLIDFGAEMFLCGKKLAEILPEYDAHYDLDIAYPDETRKFALEMKERAGGKLVLFYTSAIGNNKNWNRDSWKYADWMALAERVHAASGAKPVLIGAQWDHDYAIELKKLDANGIMIDMVGQTTIPQALAMMREGSLIVAFASGLPIVATYLGMPTVMFWPIKDVSKNGRFHPDFMRTWVPPGVDGRYIPLAYGGPETKPDLIFERVKGFLT